MFPRRDRCGLRIEVAKFYIIPELLLEEEFRIHELKAKREAIFDGIFQMVFFHPKYEQIMCPR